MAPVVTIITVNVFYVVHATRRMVATSSRTFVVVVVVGVQPVFGYRRRRSDRHDLTTGQFAFVLQEVGVHRNGIDAVLAVKLSGG